MRTSRPITFSADLNLHTYDENEIGPMIDRDNAAERKYSKKQKMNVSSSPAPSQPLTKQRNGHEYGANSREDYNDIEWSWTAADGDDDDGAVGVDDVDNGHGKFSNAIYFLKRLFSRVFMSLPDHKSQPMHEQNQHSVELEWFIWKGCDASSERPLCRCTRVFAESKLAVVCSPSSVWTIRLLYGVGWAL